MNPKRADAFYLLSDCVKNMGNIKKAETLKDYAYNLGFDQGGENADWIVCLKRIK